MIIKPEYYLFLAIALTIIEYAIVLVARRYKLGPCVTERSSHTRFTPTGGGFIWVISCIAATAMFGDLHLQQTWIFMAGVIILAVISYIDDLHPLPPVPRLISQVIILGLTFKQLCYPQALDIYLIILFCGVGLINGMNFLDGICGMLALYGLVVSSSLLYALHLVGQPSQEWLLLILSAVIVAQIVFACFNLWDVIFAGDVGSITLGFIQVFVAINLVLTTRDASYIIFFIVCIFDTGLTTVQRLFQGESILKPHRMNIYQMLNTEHNIPQVVVSIIYACLQLLIDALYFLLPLEMHWTYFLIVSALLTVAYFFVRFSFKKPKHKAQNHEKDL